MNKIVVYTIHCPQCNILEKKLQLAGIEYSVVDDREVLSKMDIEFYPAMQYDDGPLMNFKQANQWIKERTANG